MRNVASPRIVASRYLSADWGRVAKPLYLRAIDFTIGLIVRIDKDNLTLPGAPNKEVLRRLRELRERVQKGFEFSTLATNRKLLKGRGTEILQALENREAQLIPAAEDVGAFFKEFPKKVGPAELRQSVEFEKIISKEMRVARDQVRDKLMSDQGFMTQAFALCTPIISHHYASITATFNGKSGGKLEHRMKAAKSSWGKQGRDNVPFTEFRDLIGIRSVLPTIQEMARAVRVAQSEYDVLDKKNYYLMGTGYNAINYNLAHDWMVFEYQVKTSINAIEAAISHDLVYAPEKTIVALSDAEKKLVSLVIDVSTQLSMREWAELTGSDQIAV